MAWLASLVSALFLIALTARATDAAHHVRDLNRISLPLAKKFNLGGSTLVQRDQARAKALKERASNKSSGSKRQIDEPVDNVAVVYVAEVGVGSPATTFELLIDTGSSNTWVGAGTRFRTTSTTSETGDDVSVTYGSGSFSGREVVDQVSLGDDLVIQQQSIGVASRSQGFDGFDGILGIGPTDLTLGTLSPDTSDEIPTVTDNLFQQGDIPDNVVSVSFNPTDQEENQNGVLTWGGTDDSLFTGDITFVPITSTSPASEFWGIDQSIDYGDTSILSETAGIVDTGTTLVLLASDAFQAYTEATGGELDQNTGLLRITPDQFDNLESLFFNVGGESFELTPNGQIWPRALNEDIGGNANSVYLIVNDLGSNSGEGLDFINGFTFLERFYSVFDSTNDRVGFATTENTNADTN